MPKVEGVHAFVHGRVQGVFFRDFALRYAHSLGLTGFVRNLPDGETVEVMAEGEREKLEQLLHHLEAGPRGAHVEMVEYEWYPPRGQFQGFTIRRA
ncbi:MAG: acylphosphatase [Chloroflexota bacterium]